MIEATDLKSGVTFISGGKPYKVLKYSLVKLGRGGATVKVTAKNLEDSGSEDIAFSSNAKVEEAFLTKRKLRYLYHDEKSVFFMEPKTYEQTEIPLKIIDSDLPYLKESEEATLLFWGEKPLSIEIPPKVTLRVKETVPAVKGNSATNVYKDASWKII